MIFGSPAFDKADSYNTHLEQLVDALISMWRRRTFLQQLGKGLVVENLLTLTVLQLDHRRWMEAVADVAFATLHEDGTVTVTFGVHFTSHVIYVDT